MKKKIKLIYQKIKFKVIDSTIKLNSSIPMNLKLGKYTVIEKSVDIHKQLEYIGDGTYICQGTYIYHCEKIGKYCSIARDVGIGIGSHPTDWTYTSPLFYNKSRGLVEKSTYDYIKKDKKVVIGNDVWIGAKALILNGVNVGNGAIIAAGSVVTKDIEPYAIVAGVPAKVIKYRFDNFIIDQLRENDISNLEIDIIKSDIHNIQNVESFIEKNIY